MMERRNLLRGLVTLPLIGGGVTLIGRPATRVPLAEVAAAPILESPQQRARYAWEAFAAAMRELTADADGWGVRGGQMRGAGSVPGQGLWVQTEARYLTPLSREYPDLCIEQHAKLEI